VLGVAGYCLILVGCAVSPGEFARVSEAQIASTAPLPVRAIYESAIRSTVVGLVHHPVSSTSAGIAALKNRTRELVPVEAFLDDPSEPPGARSPGTPGFERYLDGHGFAAASRGTVAFHLDGAFFSRLNESIANAQSSIDWMVFIFDNDDYALSVADRLKTRSVAVKTRIMMDRLGTVMAGYSPPATPFPAGFVAPRSVSQYLRHGSQVHVRKHSNPWLVANHTKVLMFDRSTAYLGGMNIGREYRSEWHDLMAELHGPIVEELARDFDRSWRLTGYFGDLHLLDRRRPKAPSGTAADGIPIRLLETAPWVYDIERAQIAAIRASRRQIVVLTPYFTSQAMVVELQRAAARGVDVRVILPREIDSEVMRLSNAETAARMAEGGVKIHQFPGIMHLKAAIFDGWVCLGSANMDTLSLRINREKNIAFSDPEAVTRFRRQVVEVDLRRSRRLSLKELQAGRATWILPLGKQL
jgi:cardiolipin synthase